MTGPISIETELNLSARLEALLFVAPAPVPLARLSQVLEMSEEAVQQALEARRPQGQGPLTQLKERVAAVVAEMTPGRRKRDE